MLTPWDAPRGNAKIRGSRFPPIRREIQHTTYMRPYWEYHEAALEQLDNIRGWLAKPESKTGW